MIVQELLDIEKNYQDEHKDVNLVYNEIGELEPDNLNDDIGFLENGYIAKHNNIKPDIKNKLSEKGLTDFEILMLMCFEGFLSYAFKWDNYENRSSPIPEMCAGLDGVLEKSPIFEEGRVLYRFCTLDDKVDFKVGDIYEAPHYLTTTKDNWEKETDRYIITPKKTDTNARSIYKLHNHGGENQVTFKRNTKFKIVKIEVGENKSIYMEEM